jgi:N-acetylneuraminate synthase
MSGASKKIFFIAEVSANHLGSLKRAHQLVDAAADAGASAVKFQTYTADTMTLDLPEFSVIEGHELWGGRTLYSLYQEAMTPWDWHPELFEHCRERGVIPFSSPFDRTAVEFLESLNAPMYKIASLESSDHELIKLVGETGKPVIASTGATEFQEIESLVEVFRATGNKDLTLLVCTSSYPAEPSEAHIRRMKTLSDAFGVKVGLSDHTLGIGVSVAAIALGATAIEKHITLKRSDGGADGAFSMEPSEFKALVEEGKAASAALGDPSWAIQKSEAESRRLRRSLYIVENVEEGELVTVQNVRAIRPGAGCSPVHLKEIIGSRFQSNYSKGTPLGLEMVCKK